MEQVAVRETEPSGSFGV